MLMVRNVIKVVLFVCWLLVSCISLNHLYSVFPFLSTLSTNFLGGLGWSTAFLAVAYYGRKSIGQLFALVVFFMIIGFVCGPFLEPPADPLEHLRRVHELNCGKTVEQVPRQNNGLWQYSMVGVLICTDGEKVKPEQMLRKIDFANGLFWALLAAVLFIQGTRAGLPGRWAFLSVLICFLFFGTNRFSYFRYYSLAPSFSSMFVFWLWTAIFFFRKNLREIMKGLAVALFSLPIIWVNHIQESVFLGFVVLVWLVINIAFNWGEKSFLLPTARDNKHNVIRKFFTVNGTGLILLLIVCWLLPQFDFFRQWLTRFFIRDVGQQYQEVFVSWHGLYIGGQVAGLRVMDTLGGAGVLMFLV